jgi:hypothetical protein
MNPLETRLMMMMKMMMMMMMMMSAVGQSSHFEPAMPIPLPIPGVRLSTLSECVRLRFQGAAILLCRMSLCNKDFLSRKLT